jgi:hypothetical protein
MAKRILFSSFFFLVLATTCFAQGYAFGIKGGPSAGFQRWDNSFQRDPLLRYHGIVFIESISEDSRFALFAQGGLHVKGSAVRTPRITALDQNNQLINIPSRSTNFQFRNFSVSVGAKQRLNLGLGNSKLYYMFGIRGDYTISTQLGPKEFNQYDWYAIYYPQQEYVRKINYGAIFGGGIEVPFSDLIGMVFELTVNPDFSKQYFQPALNNIINPNPYGGSSLINIPQRQINNTTIELTLGFRFLHKIIYID